MTQMERTVIIHCHIFKNAGTTFDYSLERNFGHAFLAHHDDEKMKNGAEYMGLFLQRHPDIKAFSSHHIRFPLPAILNTRLLPALIIRHPIDRIGAVFLFERKQYSKTSSAANIKRMSFREYVLWRMNPTSEGVFRNFQTSYCLDGRPGVINEENYKIATKRIEGTSLLGIVDCYDESMVLFEEALRPYYPDIDLSYIKQSVTIGGEKNLEQRFNTIFKAIGMKAMDLIYANNYWDLLLYLETKSIIIKRIENTTNFTGKLNNFYQRCIALRSRLMNK